MPAVTLTERKAENTKAWGGGVARRCCTRSREGKNGTFSRGAPRELGGAGQKRKRHGRTVETKRKMVEGEGGGRGAEPQKSHSGVEEQRQVAPGRSRKKL